MKEHDFMVISASGTGGGKTALALNMLSELSKHYQCVYFNMEMAEEDHKRAPCLYSKWCTNEYIRKL